jgi:AcrR family transcriptional regulator
MSPSTKTAGSSLRAEKRQQTETEILANAIAQFCDRGVRGTMLAEVARESRVSAATLFNYFPNKGTLAEAWVRGEIDRVLVNISRDLGDHGLRSGMRNLCRELASLVSQDRLVRLEAWRESGRARLEPLSRSHPLVLALGREQQRERVRGDLSARAIGQMLIDAIEAGMIAGLQSEQNEKELAKTMRVRVDLILDGARKRNERVTAPMPSSTVGTTSR